MKAVVRDGHSDFTTKYVQYKNSTGSFLRIIKGLEYDLLKIVLQQRNMTFAHVTTPEGFETEKGIVNNLSTDMFTKKAYIALGNVGNNILSKSFF